MKNKLSEINIEEKFTELDEISHILEKAGMYIGSTYFEPQDMMLYKPSENKIVNVPNVGYNKGLLKLFNEVFQNSIDEHKRESALYQVTEINVEVYKSGKIVIQDNGGIPVVKHKQTKWYIPKMLFGKLRTSSNYTEERTGAGTNGIGAKIANIYSSRFSLETCDGTNKINIDWNNNMRECVSEVVSKSTEHYSRFEFDIELFRFDGISEIDLGTARIIQKQCIDGAAANPNLKITFKTDVVENTLDSVWKFNNFNDYVELYLDDKYDKSQILTHNFNYGDIVTILPNIDFNFSFVNGATCTDFTSTHFNKVVKTVNQFILGELKKQDIELITEKDINNKISYFINFNIANPDYDSQTKEKLTNKIAAHQLQLPKDFLVKIVDNEIYKSIVDYYNVKYLAQMKKQLRNLNKTIKTTKSKKLIKCSSSNANVTRLFIFEGTSASNGFRQFRNAMTDASYNIRGKIKNTFSLSREEIINNLEFRELLAILGLQFLSPQENLKNLKFNKVIIASDADTDGFHITGLFLAFFAKHFPELIRGGKIYRLQTPILTASPKNSKINDSEELWFFTIEEYTTYRDSLGKDDKGRYKFENQYNIDYFKGLGSLEPHHYKHLIQDSNLLKFSFKDAEKYLDNVNLWFGKSADLRKQELMSGEELEFQFLD